MNGIKLLGMGRAVPDQIMTNEMFAQRVDTSDAWITSRTGIRERRYCVDETHTQLCCAAARRALETSGVSPTEVGAVIVATVTPDWLTPAAACLVLRELGLPEDTVCFDLNAACSGFLYGLHTMECLLAAAERKVGIVIGGEVLSRLVNGEDRSTCILFGDGAGAAVVESRADYPSLCACLGVRGEEKILNIPGVNTGRPSLIHMEGTAVFKFAVETVPQCMDAVLAKAGLGVEDVDLFVFHQANARIIDLVAKKYHIPPEKYPKNIDRYGNTSAASIPLLLAELWENGSLRPGERALCVGFGGGLTWGGALIERGERK